MPSYLLILETEEPLDTPLGETDHLAIQAVDPINIEPRHTAVGLWSVDTAGVTDEQAQAIEQFAQAKAKTKIYVSDEHYGHEDLALAPGPLHNTSYTENTGELSLEGEDAGYYLMVGSSDVHYQNISVPDALYDYWSRVDGFEAQVDDAEPRIIAEDVVVQSPTDAEHFDDLFVVVGGYDLEDDDTEIDLQNLPIELTEKGIKHLPTCQHADLSGDDTDDRYSGGEAAAVNTNASFSLSYSIPNEHIGFAVREGVWAGGTHTFRVEFDGTEIVEWSLSENTEPQWADYSSLVASNYSGDFDGGGVVFQETSSDGDSDYVIDDVVVYDQRFHDIANFSSEVHEPGGYFNYPREYAPIELETGAIDAGSHVDSGKLTVSMSGMSRDQRIQISFDGETWLPADGSENNTTSIAVANDNVATTTVQGRVRLSPHEPDGLQDATPRYGYAGQDVTDWILKVDLSSLGVIEDDRFEDNDLANLQELHSRGDYRFTLIPSEDGPIQVRSYQRGTWELEADWHAIDRDRNVTTENYWNAVTIKGPRDEETGERPVTTRGDADEIDRVNERLEYTDIRNDLETEADRATVATQKLLEAVDQAEITGTIEAAPTLILPGPRYYVDTWDAWVDLEELRYSDQFGGGNALLDFDSRAMLVDRLGSTQRDLTREKR
ncbi:hypothetical protein [Natrialba sp. SSL1]|uniref:hypothetical protein n=1 Tax=Natrialba sp. SSL1 TaxID=1869245 RepID=UPI0008F95F4B|nr:hypothetical protein [Natrialba sp. SSL1]OIB56594.1 hypothetical protein BBD46_16530 [Natrialba sp. SSL1]